MRKLLLLPLLLLFALPSFAQGVRMGDNFPISSSLTTPGQISTVSNAIIRICNYPANAVPCSNLATTYTSVTLSTPCSTSIQIVLAGTNTCTGTTDARGNWGAWVAPGNIDFTVTVSTGQSFGPFTISAGNAVSGTATNLLGPGAISGIFSGNHTNTGVVTDSNASSTYAGTAATATNVQGPGVIAGTFTGSPTLSNPWTFNGAIALNGGGSFIGSFSGSPTFSGNPTFSGIPKFTGDALFGSGRPWYDVRAFGALCNNVFNDTAPIQNAINAAIAASGIVYIPPGTCRANVTLPSGVILQGATGSYTDQSSGLPASRIVTNVAGTSPVITVTASAGTQIGTEIRNLYIRGNGTGVSDQGIYLAGANSPWATIKEVSFENFGQQAILQQGPGGKLIIDQVLIISALLDRTSGSRRGAIEIHAPNAQILTTEGGPAQLSLVNAGLTNCAVLLDAGSFFLSNVTAEFGEVGFCFTSNAFQGNITNSQSNFSLGHGWSLVGAKLIQFSNNTSLNDSQATANTYDGFNMDAATNGNSFNGNQVVVSGANPVVRYGFNNLSSSSPGNLFGATGNLALSGTFGTGDFNIATSQQIPIRLTFFGSATLTFPALTQQCNEQNLTVSGATSGKAAFASPAATLGSVNLSWSASVNGSNTVGVRVCNPTAGALTPNAVTWNAWVVQ